MSVDRVEPAQTAEGSSALLPIHVAVRPGELLLSWLGRLARKIERVIGFFNLAMLGIESPDVALDDWRRPTLSVLSRLRRQTGVSLERLTDMTLTDFAPTVLHDEADERFSLRWYAGAIDSTWRARGLVICPQCLAAVDGEYIRLHWTLGWAAVCERHGTVLRTRCPLCKFTLWAPTLRTARTFVVTRCERCGLATHGRWMPPADPRVRALHASLLDGKRTGTARLPVVGTVPWKGALRWIDGLLGLVHQKKAEVARSLFLSSVLAEYGVDRAAVHEEVSDRYESLIFLAWLLDDWPWNAKAAARFLPVKWSRWYAAVQRSGSSIDGHSSN